LSWRFCREEVQLVAALLMDAFDRCQLVVVEDEKYDRGRKSMGSGRAN
jgi:hypothetical protein